MFIVCHDVFEGCRDTDIYCIDTSKFTNKVLKNLFESAQDGDWITITNSLMGAWETAMSFNTKPNIVARLPQTVEKVLTVYFS
jgi:hypothetical protein